MIERRRENQPWEEIASLQENVTTFSDTDIEPDQYYYYRVIASNEYGKSNYSNIVQFLALDIYNLALNKTVTATAQQSGNEVYRIVDGDVNTRWSAQHYPQSFEVDLGQSYFINHAEIVPYQDRAYQYTIETSTDGINYTKVVDRTANKEGGSLLSDKFSATHARYVKVTVTGAAGYTGGWASLSEFRVFEAPPQLEKVSLQATSHNVLPGEQVEFTVMGALTNKEAADLSEADIQFESSQPELITFSEDEIMTVADYVKDSVHLMCG